MGVSRVPQKVKLIVGLISNDGALLIKVKKTLEKRFKTDVDFESDVLDFMHTDYYREEMGDDLKRKFFSFKRLFDLKNMYKIKVETNSLEKKFSKSGRRKINIDPGYLDLSKLVLFSTKDFSHRVYLDKGIFAEVTLFYKDRSFNAWPWTYPDYQTKSYIDIFNSIREIYKQDLKS
jgi:hypothetical protein